MTPFINELLYLRNRNNNAVDGHVTATPRTWVVRLPAFTMDFDKLTIPLNCFKITL